MTKQLKDPRAPRRSSIGRTLRPLSLLPAFVLGLSLGGVGLGACVVPNPDHCFNLAVDTNAWCAAFHPERPYCSPCAVDNNGCVAEEPDRDDCPAYTAPAESGTAGTETGSDTETDTGSGTETGSGTDTSDTGTDTSG